eukprot:360341-Chlamydomonas_euryale.AAC.2
MVACSAWFGRLLAHPLNPVPLPQPPPAGHHTTATQVAWIMYDVASHPEVQARCMDELRAAGLLSTVTSRGRTVAWDDLTSLEYLNATVKESMRLHAVAGSTSTIREGASGSSPSFGAWRPELAFQARGGQVRRSRKSLQRGLFRPLQARLRSPLRKRVAKREKNVQLGSCDVRVGMFFRGIPAFAVRFEQYSSAKHVAALLRPSSLAQPLAIDSSKPSCWPDELPASNEACVPEAARFESNP